LKTVSDKVSLCKYCQRHRQSCQAFTGLSICAKMVHGGRPVYYVKIRPKLTNPFKNADFQLIFARSEKVQLTLLRSPLRAFQWA